MSTINSILKLEKKLAMLEDNIKQLQSKTKDMISNAGYTVYTKNLLSLSINSIKKIRIKTIDNNKASQLFQLKIRFNNYVTQVITFKLFADNIQIASETQTFNNGVNELIIYGSYTNSLSPKIILDLQVNPRGNKQVTITNTTLSIWGTTQNKSEEYQACETEDSYFLSYISNNRLYYKIFKKSIPADDVDFVYFENANSHAVCQNNNTIYLFRVDENGNLFFSTYPYFDEKFLLNNISKVSCCHDGNLLIFSYISNGKCYYGEIINNNAISNKQLDFPFENIKNCYIYYSDKCYLIITKSDNKNYLLEALNSNFSSNETIKANVSLSISTEEGS